MIHFNEQDPLKVIAMKVFKIMRPLLITAESDLINQTEADAYQAIFTS